VARFRSTCRIRSIRERQNKTAMCELIKVGDTVMLVCGGHRRPAGRSTRKAAAKVVVQFPATSMRLSAAGYIFKYTRKCRRCGALLEFWLTPDKKWAPLQRMDADPERRRVSHFSNCPFAAEFRKGEPQLELFLKQPR
jgi:hypothetical protein